MKILEVNKFNYLRGGADKYFLELSEELCKKGHEVAKFSMRHPKNAPSEWEKYFVSRVSFNKKSLKNSIFAAGRMLYSFEAKKKFKALLNDFQPDIIHLHNIYHQLTPSIIPVAKKSGAKIIMHLHDYKILCPNPQMFNKGKPCEKCKGGRYYQCALNRCFKNSLLKSILVTLEAYLHKIILKSYENVDLFIAPSVFMRNKAIEWGMDGNKIIVLPYFIDEENFRLDNYEPSVKENYLLFFGRLSEEKGLMTLFKAYDYVSKKNKDVKLKIAGEGPELIRLQNEIKRLSLEKMIDLVGMKRGEELKELIFNSLAVIVPSEWYEVTGIVNLEAGLLGKAIIASDIGGISEVVINEKTGLLFKPGSAEDLAKAMEKLLKSPELTAKLGERAKERIIANFSKNEHLDIILQIYENQIKRP